jgi:ribosomal peptide maturation radical SAM protein 1
MGPENPFRVALVYPPFGPAGLPSLGLGLLSASVKAQGIQCRTFYWNLLFLNRLPGSRISEKVRTYWWLTQRTWHPFSEWVFARAVYDEALDAREAFTIAELEFRVREGLGTEFGARDLLALRSQAEDLVDEMVQQLEPYSIVGIGTTFFQNLPALALARRVKARWPDKQIVLGGANCDGEMGPALFRNFPFLDHVLCGEADYTFPEFARRAKACAPMDGIAGMLSRPDRSLMAPISPATPVQLLDALPLPDFDDFIEQRERSGVADHQDIVLALESSRGCWWGAKHHCVFCGLNANGMAYRKKSAERFHWELEETVRRYGAKYIFMTDNILPVEYHERFMSRAHESGLDVRMFYEVKSNAKRSQVANMAIAGITAVQPGIESFSSSLLALMRKGVSAAQNVAFLRYARDYGIRASYNLLVGFPGSGLAVYDAMARSIRRLFHLRPPSGVVPIEFHRFSPYHQSPASFGLNLRPSDSYSYLYPFLESEIAQLGYIFYSDSPEADVGSLELLTAVVAQWQAAYRPDICTLTWEEAGDSVKIIDGRPDFGPRQYEVRSYARDIFRQLDVPRSISSLVSEAREATPRPSECDRFLAWLFDSQAKANTEVIAFEAEDFVADPQGCLEPFIKGGLVFEDNGSAPDDMVPVRGFGGAETRYLALPVHTSFRPEDMRWNATGV